MPPKSKDTAFIFAGNKPVTDVVLPRGSKFPTSRTDEQTRFFLTCFLCDFPARHRRNEKSVSSDLSVTNYWKLIFNRASDKLKTHLQLVADKLTLQLLLSIVTSEKQRSQKSNIHSFIIHSLLYKRHDKTQANKQCRKINNIHNMQKLITVLI